MYDVSKKLKDYLKFNNFHYVHTSFFIQKNY